MIPDNHALLSTILLETLKDNDAEQLLLADGFLQMMLESIFFMIKERLGMEGD